MKKSIIFMLTAIVVFFSVNPAYFNYYSFTKEKIKELSNVRVNMRMRESEVRHINTQLKFFIFQLEVFKKLRKVESDGNTAEIMIPDLQVQIKLAEAVKKMLINSEELKRDYEKVKNIDLDDIEIENLNKTFKLLRNLKSQI